MSAPGLRVLVVAAGLRGVTGHNLTYTNAVRRALEARGHSVTVFGHRYMDRDLARREDIQPVFPLGTYDLTPGNGPWSDLLYLWAQSHVYSGELRRALRGQRFDLVLCHTIADFELLAWSRFVRQHGLAGRLAVVQRLTPGYATCAPWRRTVHPYWGLRPHLLRSLRHHLGARFALLTDSDILSRDYAVVYGHPIVTLPMPLTGSILDEPPPAAVTARPRVGYLGDSRAAKGFDLLPEAIERVLAQHRDVRFVVQVAVNEYDAEAPAAVARLEALCARHPEHIELLRGSLSDQAYLETLRSLDLVLLPYDHSSFEAGTSNVLVESLAAGRPVVVPAGTWMAGQLGSSGAGVEFARGDRASLAAACVSALLRLPDLRAAALAASGPFRRRNNASALVDTLLAATGLGGPEAALRAAPPPR